MISKCIKSDKPSGCGHRTAAFLSFFFLVFFEVISKVLFTKIVPLIWNNTHRKFTLILALFDKHLLCYLDKVCFKKTGTECSSDTLLWFVLVFWNRCYLLCTQLFEVISLIFIFCDYLHKTFVESIQKVHKLTLKEL